MESLGRGTESSVGWAGAGKMMVSDPPADPRRSGACPMNSLRILHVVEASFAGVGRHTLDLIEGSAAAGDTVDLVYGTARAADDFVRRVADAPLRSVGTIPGGRAPGRADVASCRALRRFIRDNGPYDVVHGHASKAGAYSRVVGVGGAARVYTPNALVTLAPDLGRSQRALYSFIERRLSRRTDGLIYVSDDEAAHGRAIGLRPLHERVVLNGIPHPALPTRDEARAALGLPLDAVVVGFVGRFEPQKGLDRLLDAFGGLSSKYADVVLAVVGWGDESDALRERTGTLVLADRVCWLGQRPGQDSMPAFDVLALPSRYEGFPYVALEAMWAGVRVVATDTTGLSSLLHDGAGGVVVDGRDDHVVAAFSAALARELDQIVARPFERADRSDAARDAVRGCSVQAMVDATREFYGDVVAARGGSDAVVRR
jgi:glycosyltransferase involved in cell wall biosynthesis